MIEVKEYLDERGRSPFAGWLQRLEARAAAKVSSALYQMENGNFSDSKGIGDGISERRIHSGPGYRIYYARDGNDLVLLLGGGTKRCQKADIKAAKERWRAYQRRQARLEDGPDQKLSRDDHGESAE
jgi:putative addiction module killer protein